MVIYIYISPWRKMTPHPHPTAQGELLEGRQVNLHWEHYECWGQMLCKAEQHWGTLSTLSLCLFFPWSPTTTTTRQSPASHTLPPTGLVPPSSQLLLIPLKGKHPHFHSLRAAAASQWWCALPAVLTFPVKKFSSPDPCNNWYVSNFPPQIHITETPQAKHFPAAYILADDKNSLEIPLSYCKTLTSSNFSATLKIRTHHTILSQQL